MNNNENEDKENKGKSSPETETGYRREYRIKDKWDKWQVVLTPLGGLITGIAIATIGFLCSDALDKKRTDEINLRLYSELMSQREKAENELRSDMFQKIFDSFVEPERRLGFIKSKDNPSDGGGIKKGGEEDKKLERKMKLDRIKNDLLRLELLARNFHETIDIKPIFRDILFDILDLRRMIKASQKSRESSEEEGLREKLADMKKESSCCRRQLENLLSIAKRIVREQIEVLAQPGNYIEFEVRFCDLCTDTKPTESLKNICCAKTGMRQKKNLEFRIPKSNRPDEVYKRNFEIIVKHAYPKWKHVRVRVHATRAKEEIDCDKNMGRIGNECKEFWVSYFDFPTVDNTYLSSNERYSVALDEVDEARGVFKLVLVYFPTSHAGLKEKSFYQQKALRHLERSTFMQ